MNIPAAPHRYFQISPLRLSHQPGWSRAHVTWQTALDPLLHPCPSSYSSTPSLLPRLPLDPHGRAHQIRAPMPRQRRWSLTYRPTHSHPNSPISTDPSCLCWPKIIAHRSPSNLDRENTDSNLLSTTNIPATAQRLSITHDTTKHQLLDFLTNQLVTTPVSRHRPYDHHQTVPHPLLRLHPSPLSCSC